MKSLLWGALAGLMTLLPSAALTAREAAPSGLTPSGDAKRGAAITEKWCAECHRGGATADDRIPTLGALALNPPRTDGAVRAFLMQPHKPMPPIELETQQIEDIIAYLHTLGAGAALKP
jgi:mono/diheme cytochrome c family protein